MTEKTEDIRRRPAPRPDFDAFDRKILAALAQDAGQSYAVLGQRVGLSPPAVHERVRKLRRSGIIKGTHAALDGPALGKPLLSFIHVEAAGWGKNEQLMRMAQFPEIEEMHSVAGDASMLIKARTADTQALEDLLAQIHAVPNVSGTRTYIALSSFLERGVQAEKTEEWPAVALQDSQKALKAPPRRKPPA